MTLLNTLEESLDLSNEVKMIFEEEKFGQGANQKKLVEP